MAGQQDRPRNQVEFLASFTAWYEKLSNRGTLMLRPVSWTHLGLPPLECWLQVPAVCKLR